MKILDNLSNHTQSDQYFKELLELYAVGLFPDHIPKVRIHYVKTMLKYTMLT